MFRNKIEATKQFVARHKVGVTATATAIPLLGVMHYALKQHNDFLVEHDLYDTFYNTED